MKKPLDIRFGAGCSPIADQLEDQGLQLSKESTVPFHDLAASITSLHTRGLLNDREVNAVRTRLVQKLQHHVESLPKGI